MGETPSNILAATPVPIAACWYHSGRHAGLRLFRPPSLTIVPASSWSPCSSGQSERDDGYDLSINASEGPTSKHPYPAAAISPLSEIRIDLFWNKSNEFPTIWGEQIARYRSGTESPGHVWRDGSKYWWVRNLLSPLFNRLIQVSPLLTATPARKISSDGLSPLASNWQVGRLMRLTGFSGWA